MEAAEIIRRARPERLWGRAVPNGDCLEWTGSKDRKGYGGIRVGGHGGPLLRTHRLAWMLVHGPIPDGMVVDHYVCHNRACVNVEHLRLATSKQNNENRAGANRNSASGIRGVSWNSRLRKWAAEVCHHRKRYRAGLFLEKADAEAAVIELRNSLFTHNEADRAAA